MRKQIYCANCGGMGHIYKQCNHPITSYGIMCFNDNMEYLLVQRKDSMSYVEFIRGKYVLENRKYVYKLLSQMTVIERQRLETHDFDGLWKQLWQITDCNSFVREYMEAKAKFERLRKGIFLRSSQSGPDNPGIFFNLEHALRATKSELQEPEWGFPKGRRNINEEDFDCASREFNEETAIDLRYLQFVQPTKPFEEVFLGSNKVRYKHVYYLARYACHDSHSPSQCLNKLQLREIKAMKWFTYNDVLTKINVENIERKELFRRVHNIVLRHHNPHNTPFSSTASSSSRLSADSEDNTE